MKLQNISKGMILSLIAAGALTSCSEDMMDSINNDRNNTTSMPARFILTDVMTSSAFSNTGGDISTYVSAYIEHEAGCFNQTLRAEMRNGEPSSSATFNNVWGNVYSTLMNSKDAISKADAEMNYVSKGIAQILAAYNLALTTDMWGDTPWSESGDLFVSMTPKIDAQKDIYVDVFNYIDSALVNLELSDNIKIGNQDLIFKGKASSWIQAAYGLKARYTMRLAEKSENPALAYAKVIEYADKSFTSAKEQMSFTYKGVNINPLHGFSSARAGLAASKSLYTKLAERNDPRATSCIVYNKGPKAEKSVITTSSDSLLYLAPNGAVVQTQFGYNMSIFCSAQTAPTHMLSYHEILFLKAEAYARLGDNDKAFESLEAAVVAGILNAGVSYDEAINSIFWTSDGEKPFIQPEDVTILNEASAKEYVESIKHLFDANPLKEVMVQKYFAFWGANGESTEAYNDVRRLMGNNEDFITLENPRNEAVGFPLRLPYGNDDTANNPNVNAAFGNGMYVYSEKVWWAGGTR